MHAGTKDTTNCLQVFTHAYVYVHGRSFSHGVDPPLVVRPAVE